jgi:hypothetical protein
MYYSLMGKMRLPFIDSDSLIFYVEMPFKECLPVCYWDFDETLIKLKNRDRNSS